MKIDGVTTACPKMLKARVRYEDQRAPRVQVRRGLMHRAMVADDGVLQTHAMRVSA